MIYRHLLYILRIRSAEEKRAGILGGVFGGDPKQYVQDGYELTQLLVHEFSLPGWVNGRPSTNATNEQYLDEMLDGFREGSRAEAQRKGRGIVVLPSRILGLYRARFSRLRPEIGSN